MNRRPQTKVYFKYGAMNSGKSLELIKVAYNYIENDIHPIILKPALDTRKPGKIFSRTGLELEAIEFVHDDLDGFKALIKDMDISTNVILMEESNFVIPEIIDLLVAFGYEKDLASIMFFGLKNDFRGNLFPGSQRIIELADKIEETTSVCWCGRKARQNARIVNGEITKDGPTVLVDDDKTKVEYRVLCNYHFNKGQLTHEV